MTTTECRFCRDYALESATDNMIDHVGIRIAPTVDPETGRTYNMSRQLTDAELAEAEAWADAWLAEGLTNALGSDCGHH